jgi:GR25 family glycosyltransferase involved in LPS biosynthesis
MNNYSSIKKSIILKNNNTRNNASNNTSNNTRNNAQNSNSIKPSNYKILIVNLKKRTDRKDAIIAQLESVSFNKKYEFYDGIDGSQIEENVEMYELFKINDFGNRKGFIGCALSHYNIWIDLLKDNTNDYYYIFEDDIVLSDNFTKYFKDIGDVMVDFHNKIDILFLGYHNSVKNDNITTVEVCNFKNHKYIGGTFSYIITKRGAQKMINYIISNGIRHGIDYVIKINKELLIFELDPHIVYSDWVKEFVSEVDSDIQKDFSGFNLDKVKINTYDENSTKTFYVKMLCNWQSGNDLCNEWNSMSKGKNEYTWNNIKIVGDDYENPDYYVIVNKPLRDTDFYDPSKTIVFQMEPMCLNDNQTWGVKTWGEWANPDESRFLSVRHHKNYYNNCSWQFSRGYADFQKDIENDDSRIFKYYNYFATVCSSKYHDSGHRLRVDFLKFCESKEGNLSSNDLFKIDIYGFDNHHNFKHYKGRLDNNQKIDGYFPYKYYFIAENNSEYNYISEKLWEPILCECLCFYWGAPNAKSYINPDAFVQLDLNDFEASYNIMKRAMIEDWYSKRIDIIRHEKSKILNYYNFFPTIERIIINDIYKDELSNISNNISVHYLSNSSLISPFVLTLKDIGFNVNIVNNIFDNETIKIENINGSDYEKRLLFKNEIKYFMTPHQINDDNVKIFLKNYRQINLFEEILKGCNENGGYPDKNNFLIITDNHKMSCYLDTFLKYIDIKNLPLNYDICQLTNSVSNNFIPIEQNNYYYFKPKKYFFNNCGVYIISKKGILKVLKFLKNYVPYNDDFIYDCYENIDDFDFYCIYNSVKLFD